MRLHQDLIDTPDSRFLYYFKCLRYDYIFEIQLHILTKHHYFLRYEYIHWYEAAPQ